MKNKFSRGISLCLALFLFACTSNKHSDAAKEPMKSETVTFNKKHCITEDNCASFAVSLPEISGGDSAVVQNVNHSVQGFILSTVGANVSLPFPAAMDSAAAQFVSMYEQSIEENPDMPMGYSMEINGNTLLLNKKVATIHLDGYSYTGGAHPNPFTTIVSYNLADGGKVLDINALIADTNAVRTLLETGYKEAKGMKAEDNISELLYPEMARLPMPANTAILPQGIIFYYNAYEVAPYAVGPTEVILDWEQLGALADKTKWLE